MQTQTPRTTSFKKSIIPLKGIEPFSALMRTRPLAAWDSCMVHAHAKQNDSLDATPRIELGLIVPKKAYVLAVDRNRIRRVLRAQCMILAQELPFTVQVLFRIKATVKKNGKNKTMDAPTVNSNPHSAEFAVAIRQGLCKAVSSVTAPTIAKAPLL